MSEAKTRDAEGANDDRNKRILSITVSPDHNQVIFSIKVDGKRFNPQTVYLSAEGSGVSIEDDEEGLFLGFIPSTRWQGVASGRPHFHDLIVGVPAAGLKFAGWPVDIDHDDERGCLFAQVPIPEEAVVNIFVGEESIAP